MPRTGFPIENVGNDRRLNTSMRATLLPDRTKARHGLSFLSCPPAVSFLSCPPVVSGHPGFYSLSRIPRTGFPIENVGNDRRLNTSMRAPLPARQDQGKTRLSCLSFLLAVSFLSCPPVVSGHPGFASLSPMPRTGFPIENVGNDRRLNTSMRASLPPDRTKGRPGFSVCHSCWLFPFCHVRRLLAGIQGLPLCHRCLGLDSRLKMSGMTGG